MFKIKFILPFLLLILLQSGVSQAQAVDQYPAPMCEDEYASRSVAGIDLTALENAIYPGVGANFSWFFDSGLTAPIPTPNNITVFNLSVFYVEVNDGAFTDTATVTYDVDSLPYVWKYGPPALCEDIPGGGYASGVDLTHFQQFINGCTSTQFTWFYDSLHTSPVLDPTNVIVYDSQYYYVELLNMFIPSNCTNKSDLQFFVNPTPNAFDQTYENCAETEQTYVDLSSYNNDVEGGVGNIIRWFDDINLSSEVGAPSNYLVTNGDVIYGRVNNTNCFNTGEVTIIVNQNPDANFNVTPHKISMLEPFAQFFDQSISYATPNTLSYSWNIGGLETSSFSNPSIEFPTDTGNYLVELTVIDAKGCSGTITDYVIVEGESAVYMSNTFTPNGDGMNDYLTPQGFGITKVDYSFLVFNRWGQKVFASSEPGEGWGGLNSEGFIDKGVYLWRVDFIDVNGEKQSKIGHVSVLK